MPGLFGRAQRRVAQIINEWSSSGAFVYHPMDMVRGARSAILNAAAAASQMQTILSVAGAGTVNFVGIASYNQSGNQTLRLRVTVDGRQIFDATLSGVLPSNGFCAIGAVSLGTSTAVGSNTVLMTFQPIPFEMSLLVEFSTSIGGAIQCAKSFTHYEVDAA